MADRGNNRMEGGTDAAALAAGGLAIVLTTYMDEGRYELLGAAVSATLFWTLLAYLLGKERHWTQTVAFAAVTGLTATPFAGFVLELFQAQDPCSFFSWSEPPLKVKDLEEDELASSVGGLATLAAWATVGAVVAILDVLFRRKGKGARPMSRKAVVAVGLVALAVVLATVLLFRQQCIAVERNERERQLTSYYGIKLGAAKQEVGYALGYPSSVQGELRPDPVQKDWQVADELKVNKNGDVEGTSPVSLGGSAMEKYDEWHYHIPPDRLTVEFDKAKQTVTTVYCYRWDENSRPTKCPPLLGVLVGSSEGDVVKALGHPARQSIDKIFKKMSYPQFGLEVMLTEGRVYLVRKTMPSSV